MSDRLIDLFADVLQVEASILTDESTPDSVVEWDSLGAMNLVAEIETQFSVRLTTREIMRMASIGLAREALQSKGVEV